LSNLPHVNYKAEGSLRWTINVWTFGASNLGRFTGILRESSYPLNIFPIIFSFFGHQKTYGFPIPFPFFSKESGSVKILKDVYLIFRHDMGLYH
ncbi:MAG: hypothetical protein J7L44_03930, partial [Candidatus Diapherotrites archaeon]|nr:hypothetical protein [Candidatus Diapherotrites archaeon]